MTLLTLAVYVLAYLVVVGIVLAGYRSRRHRDPDDLPRQERPLDLTGWRR